MITTMTIMNPADTLAAATATVLSGVGAAMVGLEIETVVGVIVGVESVGDRKIEVVIDGKTTG